MSVAKRESHRQPGRKQLDPLRLDRYRAADQQRDNILQRLGLPPNKSRTKLFIRETIAAYERGCSECMLERGDSQLKEFIRKRDGRGPAEAIFDHEVAETLSHAGSAKLSGNAIAQWRKHGRIPERHHPTIEQLLGHDWKPSDSELLYAAQISAARYINGEIHDGNERHPLSPERIEMLVGAVDSDLEYFEALENGVLTRLEELGSEIVSKVHDRECVTPPYDIVNAADLRAIALLWLNSFVTARAVLFTELNRSQNAEASEVKD